MWISTYCICNYMILYVYYILWNCFMSIEIWGTCFSKKKKKIEEHEIEEKRMCFEKCFFGIQKKKIVSNNFYEKWGKILFFGRILKGKKNGVDLWWRHSYC